ncbi:MAG: SRPBCC family protein [Sphingobium sp.]
MRQQKISIEWEIPVPVERLFSHLAEHENLVRLFAPARITSLANGHYERNGIGSSRRVRPGPMPSFVETVTDYRANELIEYRITQGGLLRNHLGRMHFASLGSRASRVCINISFEGRFLGVGPAFRFLLNRSIRQGLADLAEGAVSLELADADVAGIR